MPASRSNTVVKPLLSAFAKQYMELVNAMSLSRARRMAMVAACLAWWCAGCVSTLEEEFRKAGANPDTPFTTETNEQQNPAVPSVGATSIVTMMPAAGATSVPLDVVVKLTFDRPIRAGSGSVSLHEKINQAEVERIAITDQRITIDDRTLSIDWASVLSPSTEYYVYIDPGALLDEQLHAFEGLTDPEHYRFSTQSPEPLQLVHVTPLVGATDVPPETPLSFTFSEPIVAGRQGNITITDASNAQAVDSISIRDGAQITIDGRTLSARPKGALSYGTRYRVTVDAGTVQSIGGSEFEGLDDRNPLTFTTMSPPTLELVGTVPNAGDRNVDPTSTLVFTFAEEIVAGSGRVTVHRAQDGEEVASAQVGAPNVAFTGITLSVDLTSDLETSTEYYVLADPGLVLTADGAVFGGISSPDDFSFVTAEQLVQPLTLARQSPEVGEDGVSVSTELSLTFGEEVLVGAGVVSVLTYDHDTLVETIDVASSSKVRIEGQVVIMDLSAPLDHATRYYVSVSAGSFRSAAGASFAGITDKTAWHFETDVLFGVEETAPAVGAVFVPTTTDLALTFNDDVVLVHGNVELRRAEDDVLVEVIPIDTERVRADGHQLNIKLNSVLGSETEYYVLIDSGAVRSAGGTPWQGWRHRRWTFKTEAVAFPAGTDAGLVLWLDAANAGSVDRDDGVRVWADSSGKHNNVYQSDGDARPELVFDALNGKPAIWFDGNDSLVAATALDLTGYDGFIVWQSSATAGTQRATLLANDSSAQLNHGHPFAASRDAVQSCVGQNCSRNLGWFAARFEPAPERGQASLWNWGFDAITTTVFARANGSAPVNQSGPTEMPWPAEAPLTLGNCPAARCGFEGSIAEVVIYARTLSSSERSAATAYLRGKWDLSRPSCDPDEVLGPNDSCYFVGTDSVDWTTARSRCSSRGPGWDLATVRTLAEHTFISQLLDVDTAIGATDSAIDGEWRWVTDTLQFWSGNDVGVAVNSAFTAWEAGQPSALPSEACARYRLTASGEWQWADYVCTDAHAYLCEGPAN